ncbi:MAG TPA: substrate-binding domain-containing protein [Candidatus Avoscillospira stercorigallinarum]|uniref:Substrate-binding domain-containing protein n=1 Tax=Candidatus Avoscillospira stercorigallinarum TaxID=2840708 RepID=A0A9D1CP33_9FIRM|nr:substrate-binding domain-containing protein [Candidatus Avoscillospira stercorigallinarum]
MKIAKTLGAALLCLGLLTGCTGQGVQATPRNITLVAKSTETEFWKSVFAGARAAASEYNVNLNIVGPETEEDYETQNALIEDAVAQGAEALVFSAISYTENAPAIDAAAEAGVKIAVIDSDVDSQAVGVRIGTDNVEAGRMTAQAALAAREDRLVLGLINYDLGSRNGQEREQGLREELARSDRVGEIYTLNVLAEVGDAREKTMELLRAHPEINVVVGFNEPTAVGAAQAVDRLGLGGTVDVVGFDSNVETVDLMQTGVVSALIVQNPYAMGYLGVEAACDLLGGETFDPEALLDTATQIVTRENMFSLEGQKALFPFDTP